MASFAFIVPPLMGHINPTLSLGAALLQRGHRVGWIGLDATLAGKLPEGGELLHIQYDQDDAAKKDNEQYLDQITKKNVSGIESIKFLYEDVLIPLNRFMYDGIVSILQRFQPDVIIHDHQLFAGAIAAYQLEIPYATSVTAPAAIKMMEDLPGIHEWEIRQIVGLQQELGIPGDTSVATSEALTLVYTSKAFFGDMALPDHYKFVGPVILNRQSLHPFDWERFRQLVKQPRVLVSIGTTFDHSYKKDFFGKVIAALGGEPVSVIVVSDVSLFEEWPDNFIVQEKVPQLELLPYLDAVVCHGGHNTVCETLSHGLPLVVIPIAYDQSHVAGRVIQAESGVRLNYKRFKAEHLKTAVRDVLTNPSYKTAAQRIQHSFAQAGGAATAIALLEELAIPKHFHH
ncbi:glycosyltransferase [Chitinophaga pinensis]|uniref:Glycosyltransferase, MGT family n=1 Tax=Chitinophaga pinensis (strain ATCC 43595 / DSM 2588 / LMG 13176 / NBRC 15968 / NCIMB 11800 / UQM 2034) TaxID=485918 RepID=A0A979G1B1_CHIPD|nr:nucleotide disphospho-sugar-binding domain-containing protein [Chitinophaga pinensis]ACU58943.1 glycosyltransferase, MGT family [Chitinophaga pinensis DSM 2588]